MADFPATARVPCKPLSYANKNLAEPKELLVDYLTGNIYICKTDGTFADITAIVRENINIGNVSPDSIQIEIDGVNYNLDTIIVNHNTDIKKLKTALGYVDDGSGNVTFKIKATDITETNEKKFVSATEKAKIAKIDLLDKIATEDGSGNLVYKTKTSDITETNEKQFVSATEKAKFSKFDLLDKIATEGENGKVVYKTKTSDITETTEKQFVSATEKAKIAKIDLLDKIAETDESGNVVYKTKTSDITETNEKQFVSATEKEQWSKSTHFETLECTIKGGAGNWSGTGAGSTKKAPYYQDITVSGIKLSDNPIIDIKLGTLTTSTYNSQQTKLENYSYIYKILTLNNIIEVWATKPTEVDIDIRILVER